MKPFDLELAKQGAPVCTANGRPVRILCFDRKDRDYPIVGLVLRNDGIEDWEGWTIDGRIDKYEVRPNDDNLKMVDFNEDDESCVSEEFIDRLADKIAERLKPQEPQIYPFQFPQYPSDGNPLPYPPITVMYGVPTPPYGERGGTSITTTPYKDDENK